MPQALALSDEEMDVLYRLAQPIPPRDRGAFLQAVAGLAIQPDAPLERLHRIVAIAITAFECLSCH